MCQKHPSFVPAALGALLLSHCLASYGQAANSTEETPSKLRFSGFATIGLVSNSNPDAGVVFSGAQTKPAFKGLSADLDSVLGLQLDYALLADTSMTVQAVARAGEDLQPSVRMAYLEHRFDTVNARLGRMRTPLFLDTYAEEIGYANPLIRGPIPLYGAAPSQIIHLDGASLQWRVPGALGPVLLEAYYGNGRFKYAWFSASAVEQANVIVDDITGITLSTTLGNTTLRLARTNLGSYRVDSSNNTELNNGIAALSGGLNRAAAAYAAVPAFAQSLTAKARVLDSFYDALHAPQQYTGLGFSSNFGPLTVLGDWATWNLNTEMLGKLNAWQLTLTYETARGTPYVSVSQKNRTTPRGDTSQVTPTGVPGMGQLNAGIAGLRSGLDRLALYTDASMQSFTLGARWELTNNMALKAQYDLLSTPSPQLTGAFKVRSIPFDNNVNLISVALDVVF